MSKGYRFSRSDVPIHEEILGTLDTRVVGRNIYHFETLPSTNLFARELIAKKTREGTVVVSDIQTEGRGRKSRVWFSPEGGLWFSVILYPNISPQRGMMLTMATSVSVAQGIREITGLNPVIRWPNDLLIGGRKVCGVLTELDAKKDKINFAVIGVGINVNNELERSLHGKATTLSKEFGSKVSTAKLLRSILKNLDMNYIRLSEGDHDFIRRQWVSMSDIINKEIRVIDDDSTIQGMVSRVDEDGCLVLETKKGVFRVLSGDVEYL